MEGPATLPPRLQPGRSPTEARFACSAPGCPLRPGARRAGALGEREGKKKSRYLQVELLPQPPSARITSMYHHTGFSLLSKTFTFRFTHSICMSVFPACMYVHHMHALYAQRSEKGAISPGSGVTDAFSSMTVT